MFDVNYLENLRTYLYDKTGKEYFRNIRDGREDILCTCPIHKEGQERHPSCGFSKIDKDTISAGWFHCFNCGFTGDTHILLKKLLGDKYDKEEVNRVLGLTDIEMDYALNSTPLLFNIPQMTQEVKYVSRKELEYYRVYPNYIGTRGITMDTANKYDIGYDRDTDEVTFPIRDYTGGALAVGRRSVKDKRYSYPLGFIKPLYGVYELPPILSGIEVWVVEGPFNLWTLSQYKKYGVALLGTGTRNQIDQLVSLGCRSYVLALDGDKAGRKGNIKIAETLERFGKQVSVACIPDGEDVNSMTLQLWQQMEIRTYSDWLSMIKRRFKSEFENNGNEDLEENLE